MLCRDDEDFDGDLIHKDMGTGMPFRPGSFDGCIRFCALISSEYCLHFAQFSISAIQWLCHANASNESPPKRLLRFFQSLYACLVCSYNIDACILFFLF